MNQQIRKSPDTARGMRVWPEPDRVFDLRYAAFLETVSHLRARLHRYCARMTGSALDGEDIMQEALFEAYRKIELLDDAQALRPWLFRIAHNRCIDFIRNRRTRHAAEAFYADDDVVQPVEPAGPGAGRAIERLVVHLPPKERACVLLKDVFDHSLEEIAEMVGSTPGGVKSALNRGRAKLAALPAQPAAAPPHDPELERLLDRYVALFNARDWDGVRALTSADARLQVSDCYSGLLSGSPYFVEYERSELPWRVRPGAFEGEMVLVVDRQYGEVWRQAYLVRIGATGGVIDSISDYYACPWILEMANVEGIYPGLLAGIVSLPTSPSPPPPG
ncbi:sigma-70 family RNA polymerase sigma factor [Mesorhizobium sp. B2-7-3]|uniref:sigma-70 family RNA polymerase sigma factor n=2 Tax=Mesorhizobium TaxID=68287 RepID=UPI0011287A67|nr:MULTISPECIES: sigma-70 family RNA polymerase sigma factor [unclassified Mesorhizobium]MBZ9978381.1 sigma-70 family RNA polymerase sigma factor [Mesorhizobium sp. BR-1-1-10]TPJ13256.1 sigma-70 family RNA polymerase sigma factor [Mesorhizobium sp. B2-7-3]TPK73269.1 sigma-70 family RNA polymerase sigma factor [Mesorhizobium sp. B2-4-18]